MNFLVISVPSDFTIFTIQSGELGALPKCWINEVFLLWLCLKPQKLFMKQWKRAESNYAQENKRFQAETF